jgi:F0F1-type ATP synthase membrane subunit b/b'
LSIEIAEKIIQNELSKDEKQKALVDKILDKTNMN